MAAVRLRLNEDDLKDINPESALYKRAVGTLKDAAAGKAYIAYAVDRLHVAGDTEFDDDAAVSLGCNDEGAYVLAWVWIDAESLYEEGYAERPKEEE